MELGVIRLLAAEARAAGLDPARDPIPGLRRDVLFTCTADEEAGGDGRGELGRRASARPGCGRPARSTSAAACRRRSPVGGSTRSRSRRRASPSTGSRSAGRGATARCPATTTPRSSPRPSSSASPSPARPALTPVMARFLDARGRELPAEAGRDRRAASPGDDPGAPRRRSPPPATRCTRGRCARCCATPSAPTSSTPASSTTSSRATPSIEVDCRVLPGTTEADMRAELVERARAGARRRLRRSSSSSSGRPSRRRPRARCYDLLVATIRDHDPDGDPAAGHGAVRDRRQAHGPARHPDLRLLAAPARPGRAVPRALPRRRRAGLARGAPLGPAGPLRRGAPLLRL